MAIEGFEQQPAPQNFAPQGAPQQGDLANNSGQGPNSPVLDIVSKRFNWGAFCFSWIWGLCNRSYITLVIFATMLVCWIPIIGPLVGLGLNIWFGIEGNKWAWQNKQWQSVEHFHRVQKNWAIAGAIYYGVSIVLGILAFIILGIASASSSSYYGY